VEAQLSSPTDVAIAPDGSIYIADRGNSCVRCVDPEGTISTVAGHCGEPGPTERLVAAPDGHLRQPYGVAVSTSGDTLYIADTLNHCIRKVAIAR
jgi:sugar lactone lactonase YvrE